MKVSITKINLNGTLGEILDYALNEQAKEAEAARLANADENTPIEFKPVTRPTREAAPTSDLVFEMSVQEAKEACDLFGIPVNKIVQFFAKGK